MNDSDLTAFQASQLQYLRTQVDRAQEDAYRADPHPNAQNKLFYARQELKCSAKKLDSGVCLSLDHGSEF